MSPAQLIAASAIEKADKHSALIIADISIWEISILIKKNRIKVNSTAANFLHLFLQSRNVSVQPITPKIAALSVIFRSEISSDRAYRIIAATSIIHNPPLATADLNLRAIELLDTLW